MLNEIPKANKARSHVRGGASRTGNGRLFTPLQSLALLTTVIAIGVVIDAVLALPPSPGCRSQFVSVQCRTRRSSGFVFAATEELLRDVMVEISADCRAPVVGVLRSLRCRQTGRYFTGTCWTHEREAARNFPSDVDAVEACVQLGLQDVELVLRDPGERTEFFAIVLA
jgi:hypothetical protein